MIQMLSLYVRTYARRIVLVYVVLAIASAVLMLTGVTGAALFVWLLVIGMTAFVVTWGSKGRNQ